MGVVIGYEGRWRIASFPARHSPCQRGSRAVFWRFLEAGIRYALRDQARSSPRCAPEDIWLRSGCLHRLPLLPGLHKCRHPVVVVGNVRWSEATVALYQGVLAALQSRDAEYLARASRQDRYAAPP